MPFMNESTIIIDEQDWSLISLDDSIDDEAAENENVDKKIDHNMFNVVLTRLNKAKKQWFWLSI